MSVQSSCSMRRRRTMFTTFLHAWVLMSLPVGRSVGPPEALLSTSSDRLYVPYRYTRMFITTDHRNHSVRADTTLTLGCADIWILRSKFVYRRLILYNYFPRASVRSTAAVIKHSICFTTSQYLRIPRQIILHQIQVYNVFKVNL